MILARRRIAVLLSALALLRPVMWTLIAVLAAVPAGRLTSAWAEEPAAATCDRFTLEKVRLGMTRPEVEALSLGTIEVLGVSTDTLRLRVVGPGTRKLTLQLIQDRVRLIELAFSPDKKRAEATLDDLRARWGEPEKEETPAPKKRSPYERPADVVKHFKWSDRECAAYGVYDYSGGGLYVNLSSTPVAAPPPFMR